MSHNPYSPPTAQVADLPASSSALQVEPNVIRACRLLWWYFAASLLSVALSARITGSWAAAAFGLVFGGGFSFAITFWGTSKLKAGRNWMRLLITVVNVGGVLVVPLLWNWYKPYLLASRSIDVVITVIQWLLAWAAIYLINTRSARLWFKAMKQST